MSMLPSGAHHTMEPSNTLWVQGAITNTPETGRLTKQTYFSCFWGESESTCKWSGVQRGPPPCPPHWNSHPTKNRLQLCPCKGTEISPPPSNIAKLGIKFQYIWKITQTFILNYHTRGKSSNNFNNGKNKLLKTIFQAGREFAITLKESLILPTFAVHLYCWVSMLRVSLW